MKSIADIKSYLLSREGIEKLKVIYGGHEIEKEQKRCLELLNLHESNFPNVSGSQANGLFSSPGRTEIGGNHTDHNLGKVLAAGVDLDTLGAATAVNEKMVTINSEGYPVFQVDLLNLEPVESEKETPNSLVRGIARYFIDKGYKIGGFNCSVTSRVLPGSGLSSSASFEVLVAAVFNGLFNDNNITNEEMAQAGKFAENNYYGKPSGLMDQMACSLGGIAGLDFKVPAKPGIRQLNVDFSELGYALIVTDTQGDHADLSYAYASMPKEMKVVAEFLGGKTCRDITMDQLLSKSSEVRNSCGDRAFLRAYHYLKENDRVDAQLAALEQGDGTRFINLVNESGRSSSRYLQNISIPGDDKSQNIAVAIAVAEDVLGDRGAVRVHGGGFEGTTLAVVPLDLIKEYTSRMNLVFGEGSAIEIAVRNAPAGMIAG
ncbi:MAG: galactokinase [Spirochaetales bacterium]|nr:galactokinase [Spirochaetales bacterium]